MGIKPEEPQAPNPATLTSQQQGLNLSTRLANNRFNTFDQFAPWGSTVWIRDNKGNPVGQSIILSPPELKYYQQGTQLRGGLAENALNQLGNLPQGPLSFGGVNRQTTPLRDINASNYLAPRRVNKLLGGVGNTMSAQQTGNLLGNVNSTVDVGALPQWLSGNTLDQARNQVQDALYERSMSLQRPDFERQYKRMNTELVNRGIPLQSEIDKNARRDFYNLQDEAQQRAALDAIAGGRNELTSLFGMNAQQRAQALGEQQALGAEQNRILNANLAARQAQAAEQNRVFNTNIAARQAQGAEQNRVANMQLGLRQQAINEMMQKRYEPINLISSFMQGAPAMPTASFQPTPSYQTSPPDFMGAAMQNYGIQNANYQNARNSTNSGLFGLGSALIGLLG